MLFNSPEFLLFYPTVFIVYWLIPNKSIKLQNILLLVSSYFFYAWWDWRFLSLIAFSTIVDYILGLAIADSEGKKRFYLFLSICTNLGLLTVFKYFNFFIDSWIRAWAVFGYEISQSTLSIILPVGISFYTFQTMSYSIDIYRKEIKPTKDFIAFATFVSMFPQLVAGPIERASNLIPQIINKRIWSHKKFKEGLLQIAVGFFRKVVVADNIGALIDDVYNMPELFDSSNILMAVVLYSFQIYYDFSGYSDIAIGTAKLLGFEFKQNFNLPYFSSSITEFWRRWHISLSTWLRDYLYIPLGGNRKGTVKQYRNLFVTMFLGGLWHGSSWNFVIWGSIHGLLLAFEKKTNWIPKTYKFLNNMCVFCIVSLIWIFFRAINFNDTLLIFKKLFSSNYGQLYIGDSNILVTTFYGLGFALSFDVYLFAKRIDLENLGSKIGTPSFIVFMTFILMNILMFYSSAANFIYFQF